MEELMKINTKPVPVIITLAAAFISCVISIVQKVDFSTFVSRLLIVVVIFLVMGTIIKMILDYAFKTLEPAVSIDAELEDTATIEDSDQAIEDISSENLQESE